MSNYLTLPHTVAVGVDDLRKLLCPEPFSQQPLPRPVVCRAVAAHGVGWLIRARAAPLTYALEDFEQVNAVSKASGELHYRGLTRTQTHLARDE